MNPFPNIEALRQDIREFFDRFERSRGPEPDRRGRWAVIWRLVTGVVIGHRFSSKRRARAFARWKGGRMGCPIKVIRYRERDWITTPGEDAPGLLSVPRTVYVTGTIPVDDAY